MTRIVERRAAMTALRAAILALVLILALDTVVVLRSASLWAVPLALLGWFLADLLSGVVHMVMDYRPTRAGAGLDRLYFYEGSRESPEYLALRQATFARIGGLERVIYDFKTHHPRPDALGRRPFASLAGPTILGGTLPLAIVASAAVLLTALPDVLLAVLVPFVLGTSFAQYFHATLHRSDSPWIVRLLRRCGLLMRPHAHRHHHDTLDRDFSTISGWSNPVLNPAFRVLRRLGYMPDEGLIPR